METHVEALLGKGYFSTQLSISISNHDDSDAQARNKRLRSPSPDAEESGGHRTKRREI